MERELEVKITLTEDDLNAMEKKYGTIEDAGDAYDCIFEAITTWLEL